MARLDEISTSWSLLEQAQEGSPTQAGAARNTLVLRYANAIKAYVRAIVKNPTDADELAQDMVVRVLGGDFAGADPQRGRFRNLLKVATRNMIRNYWAKEQHRQGEAFDDELHAEEQGNTGEQVWLGVWREATLGQAWQALESYESNRCSWHPWTLLKLRRDLPQANMEELAAALRETLATNVQVDTVRQQLRRARLKFAQLLLEEIARGLDDKSPSSVREELSELGLLDHVRDFLPDDWDQSGMLKP